MTNPSSNFVSIIIINFNGGTMVQECIESIKKTKTIPYEIILIDNASTDNSFSKCKKIFPDIVFLKNKKNVGLGARNLGLEIAKGNFIVFLDFDTIVEPSWLEIFINSFAFNGDGLYQPKLLESNRRDIINSAGNLMNIFGLAYSRGKGEKDIGQYDKFSKISYTSGACTFTSKKITDKVGKIDDIFFAYHDDVDYGWRAAMMNIPSYYEPKSIIYHYGSKTLSWSPKKFFLLERNRWICLQSLYSNSSQLKLFPYMLIIEIGISLFFISKGIFFQKIKALISLIKLNKQIRQRRLILEEKKIISDQEIIKNFVDDFFLPSQNGENNRSFFSKIIELLSKKARKSLTK